MLIRYRIVKDNYAGYECQVSYLWIPIWFQINGVNTHNSIAAAKKFILAQKGDRDVKAYAISHKLYADKWCVKFSKKNKKLENKL